MVSAWELFTPSNLTHVQIALEDGQVVGDYHNMVLVNETSTVLEDGKVETSFNLREKTPEEVRLDALEAAMAVHDSAINDLGAATSEISDKIGGIS